MIWWVGAGGILGALSRYGLGLYIGRKAGKRFPWGTLLINLAGSLLLGILAGSRGRLPEAVYLFGGTGFCGGFTTFSTFGYETMQLLERKRTAGAALYVLGSVLLGLAGAFSGLCLADWL
ncbi:fluoride efflux transporter CrcB [Paenibacillus tengchongensis]|uniref:fluoride efflux transporter CrcB n=1 Tax=Paenibacillus tengchongensis TaxID=2608684 RepID=UPI00124CB514|nr:fluoride efflux transporter CrcB [Paenibacillus tengchongensis]